MADYSLINDSDIDEDFVVAMMDNSFQSEKPSAMQIDVPYPLISSGSTCSLSLIDEKGIERKRDASFDIQRSSFSRPKKVSRYSHYIVFFNQPTESPDHVPDDNSFISAPSISPPPIPSPLILTSSDSSPNFPTKNNSLRTLKRGKWSKLINSKISRTTPMIIDNKAPEERSSASSFISRKKSFFSSTLDDSPNGILNVPAYKCGRGKKFLGKLLKKIKKQP